MSVSNIGLDYSVVPTIKPRTMHVQPPWYSSFKRFCSNSFRGTREADQLASPSTYKYKYK